MPDVKIIVLVEKQKREAIESIAEALQSAGMVVTKILKEIRMITGSAKSELLDALKEIDGVEHLREDGEIVLAPPDGSGPE
ncbi:MAG: hypothetical protein AAF441_21150 [Pseudomonadota bacterium]